MNLRHLAYFVALAREGHFGRAAQSAHITQPTLSAALRQLEDELDVPLVLRSRQRFEGLTAEGREVLVWAQRMLAESESLQQYLAGLKGPLTGRLRIGVIPTAEPLVARLTQALQARHPAVSVALISSTSSDIERDLAVHRLDAGITYADSGSESTWRSVPLYRERYVVAGQAALLRGYAREISWADAARLPLCLLTRDMQNRRLLDRHFAEAGVVPAVVAESNTLIGVLSHLDSGGWCGILPAAMVRFVPRLKRLGLVAPAVSHRVDLRLAERQPLPPLSRALVDVAAELNLEAHLSGAGARD